MKQFTVKTDKVYNNSTYKQYDYLLSLLTPEDKENITSGSQFMKRVSKDVASEMIEAKLNNETIEIIFL